MHHPAAKHTQQGSPLTGTTYHVITHLTIYVTTYVTTCPLTSGKPPHMGFLRGLGPPETNRLMTRLKG